MTTIYVITEYGKAEFAGEDPYEAHKVLKRKLRQIKLSIKKLLFIREMEDEIIYAYSPTGFRYESDKAKALMT